MSKVKLSYDEVVDAIFEQVEKQVDLTNEQAEWIYDIIEGWLDLQDLEDEINSYLNGGENE